MHYRPKWQISFDITYLYINSQVLCHFSKIPAVTCMHVCDIHMPYSVSNLLAEIYMYMYLIRMIRVRVWGLMSCIDYTQYWFPVWFCWDCSHSIYFIKACKHVHNMPVQILSTNIILKYNYLMYMYMYGYTCMYKLFLCIQDYSKKINYWLES